MKDTPERPLITNYEDPIEFVRDMIAFRKKSEPSFSVMTASRSLRKLSPTLVTLILQKKRKITIDRIDELSKLLKLHTKEKFYFRDWLERSQGLSTPGDQRPLLNRPGRSRKEVSSHILKDWVNVYVKDCFEIPSVQQHPELIYEKLATLASRARIDRCISFLSSEGHLRRTIEGSIVPETPLVVTDSQVSDKKVRQFHKGALDLAKAALDLYPIHERFANAMTITLNEQTYNDLIELIQEFAEKLKNFNERPKPPGERLYQLIVNLSPTGGKFE